MKGKVNVWVMFVALEICFTPHRGVGCYDHQDVLTLKDRLFTKTSYDSFIRPVMNQSNVLQITIGMSISFISNFTISSARLNMLSLLEMYWIDEQLQWNASEYGGLDRVSLDSDTIWIPIITQLTDIGYEFPVSPTWVYSNGAVVLMRIGQLKGRCTIDMHYFPYDTHECHFTFVSVVHQSQELAFQSLSDKVSLDLYMPSGQWDVLDSKSFVEIFQEEATGFSSYSFVSIIKIRRRPQFLLLHVTIPMALILILNTFVYIVPLESGERISISVTLLLTMAFFTTDLSDTIPESSDNISLLSMILVAVNSSSAFSVATSVVLCHVVTCSKSPIPRGLVYIMKVGKRSPKVAPEKPSNNVENISIIPDSNHNELDDSSTDTSTSAVQDAITEERVVTWTDVAKFVDSVLFWVTLSFVTVVCVGFLGVMLHVHLHSFKYDP